MEYGKTLGLTTGLGAAAITVLPKTGGSRSLVADIALLSLFVGAAVLVSTVVRFAVKRHYQG